MLLLFATTIATATSAEELCGPTDDPCVVARVITITDADVGALDIGTRALHIVPGGRLLLPDGGTIGCGSLQVSTENALAIDARTKLDDGVYGTGVGINVRRACSGDTALWCTADYQCDFSLCDRFACSDDPTQRCSVDTQCVAGVCNVQVCSRNANGAPRQCGTDVDCDVGTCTVGDGSAVFDGGFSSRGIVGGSLQIRTAGSLDVLRTINLNTTLPYGRGANLTLDTGDGDLTVSGVLRADYGDSESGSDIRLEADGDIYFTGKISLQSNGGLNTHGGTIALDADGDVSLSGTIKAKSHSGGGNGSDVRVDAGGSVAIENFKVDTDAGYANIYFDIDPGSGGYQNYSAGDTLTVAKSTRFRSHAGGPLGYAGEIIFESGGDLSFAGRAAANGRGESANGGLIVLDTDGNLSVTSKARLLTRTSYNGFPGIIALEADGNLTMKGKSQSVDYYIRSGADLNISGRVQSQVFARCEIDACRMTIEPGGKVSCTDGTLDVRAEEQLTVAHSATLKATNEDGRIELTVPSPMTPITVDGRVSPRATTTYDPSLAICSGL